MTDEVLWEESLSKALQIAKDGGKLVLLDFFSPR